MPSKKKKQPAPLKKKFNPVVLAKLANAKKTTYRFPSGAILSLTEEEKRLVEALGGSGIEGSVVANGIPVPKHISPRREKKTADWQLGYDQGYEDGMKAVKPLGI